MKSKIITLWYWLLQLFYPQKCILCRKLLTREQTDLCTPCRRIAPEFTKPSRTIPFIENWTALWYYSGNVRRSILRYKFYNARSYAKPFGRLLAMKLLSQETDGIQLITWVPVSFRRRLRRGFDQSQLLAQAIARELGVPAVATLIKTRHTTPQSVIREDAARRANVLGAYRIKDPALVQGKTILLIDDIVTTGATVSECAKILLTAGARQIHCAALAASNPKK